jgi:RimJ/RimL family protein N-acetyltransferase
VSALRDSALTTERLLLRPFTPDDFEPLLAIESRPDIARWLYWEARGPDQVRTSLQNKVGAVALAEDDDWISLAVVLKESGELIGDCMLRLASREHRQGEIGFLFHPDHHGRGYATEAAFLLLEIAFDDFGLHRVVGRLEPRNTASAGVLERIGMRREAHLIENEFVKGEWQSELVYAILRREWRAAQTPGG